MNFLLRQIYRCDICIIPKNIKFSLNIFRTRLKTEFQKKSVGRHTFNILFGTKSTAHYNDKLFPDGEVYMLPSKMHISELPVLLLNQRILFI